ncbi:MAG: diaminopimelate epimerase, partial [Acidobacteria bacterium]|nr:diaminopimelate epimerase [Acidobacteriota bacterium]
MPVSNLRFVKMSGAGNDFVVADNRGGAIEEAEKPPLARRACRRKLGIGADGLILVERGGQRQDADYVMRYFNA